MSGIRPLVLPATIKVAGVSHRQDTVRTAVEGQPVKILADPSNPHDHRAHAVVDADGRLFGYVPAVLLDRLLAHQADGFVGEIAEVLVGETWGLRVRVAGPLQDAGLAPSGADPDDPYAIGDELPDDRNTMPADDGQSQQVLTLSGRLVGTLAGRDGRYILVDVDGRQLRYPADVVRLAPAA